MHIAQRTKNSVRTAKEKFTITNINRLTLFKEMIPVYTENHKKPKNEKCNVTDSSSRWDFYSYHWAVNG
jgi:hypothetical protein